MGSRNRIDWPPDVSSITAALRPSGRAIFSRQLAESSPDQTNNLSICGWGPCTVIPAVVKRRLSPSVVFVPRSASPARATPPSCMPSGGSSVIPTVIDPSSIGLDFRRLVSYQGVRLRIIVSNNASAPPSCRSRHRQARIFGNGPRGHRAGHGCDGPPGPWCRFVVRTCPTPSLPSRGCSGRTLRRGPGPDRGRGRTGAGPGQGPERRRAEFSR